LPLHEQATLNEEMYPLPARLVIEAGASREKPVALLVGLLPQWDSVFADEVC
jgi:hypothetical protein